jgi:DNA replication and repair protein RecF
MKVEALELTNFRSYESARFKLHPEVTLVVGPNASGKTNLLESLYVLASTRSFRAKDKDLVRHGQDHYRVVATAGGTEYALGYAASGPSEKKITHDGVKRTLIGHVGLIQVTLFEPTDMDLVAGAPEARRRYLDFLLCQTDRSYLKVLQHYRRVLRQRNALLDGFDMNKIREQIFAWDMKLAELALAIYRARLKLLESLQQAAPLLYKDIAGEAVNVRFEYLPSVTGIYESEFLEALAVNLTRDMAAGFTTIGPHREDFKIHFKDNVITTVASRGETRTLVLAMKLAELGYAEEHTGSRPLLLLDDVFSELDKQRRGYLLNRLEGYQTVVTTTDADAITRDFKTPHMIIKTGATAHA